MTARKTVRKTDDVAAGEPRTRLKMLPAAVGAGPATAGDGPVAGSSDGTESVDRPRRERARPMGRPQRVDFAQQAICDGVTGAVLRVLICKTYGVSRATANRDIRDAWSAYAAEFRPSRAALAARARRRYETLLADAHRLMDEATSKRITVTEGPDGRRSRRLESHTDPGKVIAGVRAALAAGRALDKLEGLDRPVDDEESLLRVEFPGLWKDDAAAERGGS